MPRVPDAPLLAQWRELLRQRSARAVKRLVLPYQLRALDAANRASHTDVTAPGGPVVSLTTYGPRLALVHLTLESIARGTLRPSRLILWLDDTLDAPLPDALSRLARRGLEIRRTPNFGPHNKYHPYLQSTTPAQRHGLPLVTADDDTVYPEGWLAGLHAAWRLQPGIVHCWNARVVTLTADGLAPYAQWPHCRSIAPSMRHVALGVSGTAYPTALQDRLQAAGAAFTAICPRADDLWLHLQMLRAGILVRQLAPRARLYPELPGSQAVNLAAHNVHQGGNDQQAAALYDTADLMRLRAAD